MATLQLKTDGENITWPAVGAGNGMAVSVLFKRPSGSTQSDLLLFGICTSGALSAPSTMLIAMTVAGNTNGINSTLWFNATSTDDTTNDTPVDNKRALIMVGYADNGTTLDLYGQWKDEDGTGATKSWLARGRPSWPPSTGEIFVLSTVAGSMVDEVLVFDQPYSSTLFDAVYTELLT